VFINEKMQLISMNASLFQKPRTGISFIVVGALIPVVPFYIFISYYLSLDLAFACSYLGWESICGTYATIWLVSEVIGLIMIIKGLVVRQKK
jgi:hypothetical protein